MLATQKKYITYLREVQALNEPDVLLGDSVSELQATLIETELLVPVIGAFSSGKSSLLNIMLERDILPVGIAPETDLATELRASQEERIEAVKEDGSFTTFSLDQFNVVSQRASEFNYLRLFVDSDQLRRISPLVLVDMPGFDSTLDGHNKAIQRYISLGQHYIVLTSVEDGTISKSVQRNLQTLLSADCEFTFVLSKCNLKPQSDVEAIKNAIAEQAEVLFDYEQPVLCVSDREGDQLVERIGDIDPELLFKKACSHKMLNLHGSITQSIELTIKSLLNSEKQSEKVIQDLQESLDEIDKKRSEILKDIHAQYAGQSVSRCLSAVSSDLSAETPELANMIAAGDTQMLKNAVTDIVRSTMMREMRLEIDKINGSVSERLSGFIDRANLSLKELEVPDEWVEQFSEKLGAGAIELEGTLRGLSSKLSMSNEAGRSFKIAMTTVAVTTSVVVPLVELLIIFLPEILKLLSNIGAKEQARSKLKNTLIPKIVSSLKLELPEIFNNEINSLVQKVSESYEEKIKSKREALVNANKSRSKEASENQANIAELKQLHLVVNEKAEAYLLN